MITLVDTSVWRHHFNNTLDVADQTRLDSLLDQDDSLACHPAVFGELFLGGINLKAELMLLRLPQLAEISSTDTLAFIRTHKLAHKGVGWVDSMLLATAVAATARLWSLDTRLQALALAIGAG